MNINMTYDHNFVEILNKIKAKYPMTLLEADGIGDNQLDIATFSKKFMTSDNTSNASIDSNGNVDGISMVTYGKEVGKPIAKLNGYYLMWREIKNIYGQEFANQAIESAINGDIYVHDSTNFSLSYCFNFTAYDIVLNGLPSWTGIGTKLPPKTLLAYTEQTKNFLISASGFLLGATGIADFLVFASWFVERNLKGIHEEGGLRKEDFIGREELFEQRVWEQAKQILTSWVYNINDNYRGDQTLFTNISIYDKYFLQNIINDINMVEAPYKIDIDVAMKVQELFVEIMNEELSRTPLTYPVTTASCTRYDEKEITLSYIDGTYEKFDQFSKVNKKVGITSHEVLAESIKVGDTVNRKEVSNVDIKVGQKNILRDQDFVRYVAEANKDYQFINIFNGESSVLSSCCRLRSDMSDFEKETFEGGSSKIGSVGVVTLNLPRVAFKYKNGEIDSIEDEIKRLTEISIKINYARRVLVKDKIDRGMLPVYTDGFMVLERQFSTTGIIGGYEFSKILGIDILTENGLEEQMKLLKVIRDTQDDIHENDPLYKEIPFNVEQIPGESTAIKLAKKDELMGYNNIGIRLYANQFIPAQTTANILDRIRVSAAFDESGYLNGGSILHLNSDTRIESTDKMVDMINMVAKTGVSYWAINFDLLYCEECNTFDIKVHDSDVCKHCGSTETSSYIRVVGFLTKVKSWHDVRQSEDYNKRQFYNDVTNH